MTYDTKPAAVAYVPAPSIDQLGIVGGYRQAVQVEVWRGHTTTIATPLGTVHPFGMAAGSWVGAARAGVAGGIAVMLFGPVIALVIWRRDKQAAISARTYGVRRIGHPYLWAFLFLLVIFDLLGWLAVFRWQGQPPRVRIYLAMGALALLALAVFLGVRGWRRAVVFGKDLVSIRGLFLTRRLRASDIERFEMRHVPGGADSSAYEALDAWLRGGERVPLFGGEMKTLRWIGKAFGVVGALCFLGAGYYLFGFREVSLGDWAAGEIGLIVLAVLFLFLSGTFGRRAKTVRERLSEIAHTAEVDARARYRTALSEGWAGAKKFSTVESDVAQESPSRPDVGTPRSDEEARNGTRRIFRRFLYARLGLLLLAMVLTLPGAVAVPFGIRRAQEFRTYGVKVLAQINGESCSKGTEAMGPQCNVSVSFEVGGSVVSAEIHDEDQGDVQDATTKPGSIYVVYDRRNPSRVALPYVLRQGRGHDLEGWAIFWGFIFLILSSVAAYGWFGPIWLARLKRLAGAEGRGPASATAHEVKSQQGAGSIWLEIHGGATGFVSGQPSGLAAARPETVWVKLMAGQESRVREAFRDKAQEVTLAGDLRHHGVLVPFVGHLPLWPSRRARSRRPRALR